MGFGSGGYGSMGYGDGAAADAITGVMLPSTVQSDGGTLVTVTATIAAGTYIAHLGPTGTTDDPVAFAGQPGGSGLLVITSGQTTFQLWTPPNPPGANYPLFLEGVGSPNVTISNLATYIKHDFRSKALGFRRDNFPPQWALGYRQVEGDQFFFNLDESAPPTEADPGVVVTLP